MGFFGDLGLFTAFSLIQSAFAGKSIDKAYKRSQRASKAAYENNVREAMAQREYDLPINQMQRLRDAGFLPSMMNSPGSYGNVALNTSNDYSDPTGNLGDVFNMYNLIRQRKMDAISIKNENRRLKMQEEDHNMQREQMKQNAIQQAFNNHMAEQNLHLKDNEFRMKHGIPLNLPEEKIDEYMKNHRGLWSRIKSFYNNNKQGIKLANKVWRKINIYE